MSDPAPILAIGVVSGGMTASDAWEKAVKQAMKRVVQLRVILALARGGENDGGNRDVFDDGAHV